MVSQQIPPSAIRDTCAIPLPDYPFGMFFLTRREQLVMVFILAALLAGAGVRHVRLERMLPAQDSSLIKH